MSFIIYYTFIKKDMSIKTWRDLWSIKEKAILEEL